MKQKNSFIARVKVPDKKPSEISPFDTVHSVSGHKEKKYVVKGNTREELEKNYLEIFHELEKKYGKGLVSDGHSVIRIERDENGKVVNHIREVTFFCYISKETKHNKNEENIR
jgi:hypothetical protein